MEYNQSVQTSKDDSNLTLDYIQCLKSYMAKGVILFHILNYWALITGKAMWLFSSFFEQSFPWIS